MTERSEWQSPAAPMRTRISPGPGGLQLHFPILSGFDLA